MSKYKVGDKVRIRRDLKWGDYGDCFSTTTMAHHAGEVVTVKKVVECYPNRFKIVEKLPGCELNWSWSDEMVEPAYKIGDHVVCEKSNVPEWYYSGKTGVINRIDNNYGYPYRVTMDDGSPYSWCTVRCLVEEKKVFTKKDLKNGDVIVRRNGNVEIAIVDLNVLITEDGCNNLYEVTNDLTRPSSVFNDGRYDIMKVYRPTQNWHCQLNASEHGELVYDRERDTEKPLYNGKVVCIDNKLNEGIYTIGKLYQFKDGLLTGDTGDVYLQFNPVRSFEEWTIWTGSKFIEIKE